MVYSDPKWSKLETWLEHKKGQDDLRGYIRVTQKIKKHQRLVSSQKVSVSRRNVLANKLFIMCLMMRVGYSYYYYHYHYANI